MYLIDDVVDKTIQIDPRIDDAEACQPGVELVDVDEALTLRAVVRERRREGMVTVFGLERKTFIMSQLRQHECLEMATGLDWGKLDLDKAAASVGKVINPRLMSYHTGVNSPQTLWEAYWNDRLDW